MRSPQTGDGFPRLRKRNGVTGMRVDDGANTTKSLKQAPVSWSVRRRTQRSVHYLPFQTHNHDIIRPEDAVVDTARLNRKNATTMIRHTNVTERQVAQFELRQQQIRFVTLFLDSAITGHKKLRSADYTDYADFS